MKMRSEILFLITISSLLVSTFVVLGIPSNITSEARLMNNLTANSNGLVYSTFFGGLAEDYGHCIVRDSQNNTIIAGITFSSNFPTTEGTYDRTYNGESDVFVSKFAENGSLVFSTYFGGSSHDSFMGSAGVLWPTVDIVLDNADNIVIYGTTQSSDFPETEGAYDSTFNGNQDIFIAKLSADGTTLLFSTFLGGTGQDSLTWAGNWLVLDGVDNVYVTGYTNSSDYPVTGNAYDGTINGDFDVFISKLSSDGSELLYSTFLGGVNRDYGQCLALDSEGNIIIGGITSSSDWLTTEGAFNRTKAGPVDGYVTKLSANGSTIEFSTFFGGNDWEYVTAVVTDEDDDIFCAGATWSSDFPVTANAFDKILNGRGDAYVTKISANCSILLASTYIGGSDTEISCAMILDAEGNPCITGYTASADYPTTGYAYQPVFGGIRDFFITKLDSGFSDLDYSSYLGGSGGDDHGVQVGSHSFDAGDIELVSEDEVYIIGSTNSTDFPVSDDALSKTLAGESDVFITHLDWSTAAPITDTTTDQTTPGFDAFTGAAVLLAVSTLVWYTRQRKRNR